MIRSYLKTKCKNTAINDRGQVITRSDSFFKKLVEPNDVEVYYSDDDSTKNDNSKRNDTVVVVFSQAVSNIPHKMKRT